MKLAKSFFLITLFSFSITLSAQEKIFNLHLEGKSFDRLFIASSGELQKTQYIEGESGDGYNWIFRIPEEDYKTSVQFQFSYQEPNEENNERYYFLFLHVEGKDTLANYYINFADDNMSINARYVASDKVVLPFGNPTIFNDRFLVNIQGNADLMLRFRYPLFSFFQNRDGVEKEYEDFLEEYCHLCLSNPDSRYLLTNIFRTRERYRDRNDIKKLYDCFSPALKNSYYGNKVARYLTYYDFENTQLLYSDNTNKGYVIENPEKYNLLVFSASWCVHCHKWIPTLKKMNVDLQEEMDIIYISIDESGTLSNWQDFLEKENIPWRSFISYNNKDFRARYDIQAIPTALLISPDGKAEVINIGREEEVQGLYKLFNK